MPKPHMHLAQKSQKIMSKLNMSMYKNSVHAINQVRFMPGMELLVKHLKINVTYTSKD